MNDLTTQEMAQAAEQGWELCYVFDLGAQRWARTVLPIQFTKAQNAAAAFSFVVSQAKQRDPLSTKALQLMAAFNTRKKR